LKFRRQVPIGRYIVDLFCSQKRLIIELDGGQHNGSARDVERDAWLRLRGYRVLRFWNNDVLKNPEAVITALLEFIKSPSPPPTDVGLRRREGEGRGEGSTGLSREDSR
jgi:very-short-patch-repair endonuclease